MEWWYLLLALFCNAPIGYIAIRKQSLTFPGGVIAAGVMGLFLFIVHPLYWMLLLTFFGSSTILTHFQADTTIKKDALSLAEKGGKRDFFQVLANGGFPLLLSIIALLMEGVLPVEDLQNWYSIGVAISFAVVNADTWATELGVTSNNDPYWILNPTKTVPRGTSGGISSRGLFASLLAALLVSSIFSLGLVIANQFQVRFFILITIGGIIGSVFDSLLGATIQAQYYCVTCSKMTEQQFHHRCQTQTQQERGLAWFNNDLVNLISVILAICSLLPFLW